MMKRLWHQGLKMAAAAFTAALAVQAADEGKSSGSITLGGGFNEVRDNENLFREQNWQRERFSYGIENLTFTSDKVDVEARSMPVNDDYKLELTVRPNASFFIRGGVENYEKYFDDVGYYTDEAARGWPNAFERDDAGLTLDIGKLFVEVGNKNPDGLNFLLGYEHSWKEGMKSTLNSGYADKFKRYTVYDANMAPGNPNVATNEWGRYYYPGAKDIDEYGDVIRLDLWGDFSGFEIANKLRYETYDTDNTRTYQEAPAEITSTGLPVGQSMGEQMDSETWSDAFTVEKWVNDRLFLSGGYMYINNDNQADRTDESWAGYSPAASKTYGLRYYTADFDIDTESHLFNANGLLVAAPGVTLLGGAQYETSNTDVSGAYLYQRSTNGTSWNSANTLTAMDSDEGIDRWDENVELRLDLIPYTTVYGRVVLTQEDENLDETRNATNLNTSALTTTLEDMDRDMDQQQYRTGFTSSPCSRISLSSYYQRTNRSTDYDTDVNGADSSFMNYLDTTSDEVMAKLSYRVTSWMRTSLKYQLVQTQFENSIEDLHGDSGELDSNIYSWTTDLTVIPKLTLSGSLVWEDVKMVTDDLDAPTLVNDYNGDVYTVLLTALYELSEKTGLEVTGTYSRADNQNQAVNINPTATDTAYQSVTAGVTHAFSEKLSGKLQYTYMQFDNYSYADYQGDYQVHGVYGSLTAKF